MAILLNAGIDTFIKFNCQITKDEIQQEILNFHTAGGTCHRVYNFGNTINRDSWWPR